MVSSSCSLARRWKGAVLSCVLHAEKVTVLQGKQMDVHLGKGMKWLRTLGGCFVKSELVEDAALIAPDLRFLCSNNNIGSSCCTFFLLEPTYTAQPWAALNPERSSASLPASVSTGGCGSVKLQHLPAAGLRTFKARTTFQTDKQCVVIFLHLEAAFGTWVPSWVLLRLFITLQHWHAIAFLFSLNQPELKQAVGLKASLHCG